MSANSTRRKFFHTCLCCEQPVAPTSPARRSFLAGGAAALGLGAVSAVGAIAPAAAQAPAAKTRIDVHHHYIPPFHADALVARRAGGRPPQWSAAKSLEDMDKSGIATAIVSVVQPGVWLGNVEESRSLARQCNEYGAKMVQDHPGRFGLFAVISPPDTEGSLKEIEYALDTLKADGIGLMTSYGDKWPGDPVFAPVFEELDRRQAVVYFHPTTAACCGNLISGLNPAPLEWPFDTARAVASLLFNGSLVRFPKIRFIFSHAGGALPALSGRITNMSKTNKDLSNFAPQGIPAEFAKLHFDTANAFFAPSMAALMELVPMSQILFGSDYPYFTLEENVAGLGEIRLNGAERQAINRGNAARLMPQYQG